MTESGHHHLTAIDFATGAPAFGTPRLTSSRTYRDLRSAFEQRKNRAMRRWSSGRRLPWADGHPA